MENSFIDELYDNRGELFDRLDNRIRENKVAKRNDELLFEETLKVANAILKLVLNIFVKANTEGELISEVDEELGKLADASLGEKASQYNFSDDGLSIVLNYTKPPINMYPTNIENFAKRVDWNYLATILGAYGIDIKRDMSEGSIVDGYATSVVDFDLVTIFVDKNLKERNITPRDYKVLIDEDFFNQLWNNRSQLFRNVKDRIAERKAFEKRESEIKEKQNAMFIKKSNEVLNGIGLLLEKIINEGVERKARIENDDLDDSLGRLGSEWGSHSRSYYEVDDNALTIFLDYSMGKDFDSYAECFGDMVDWDYLVQKLKAKGIDISRHVRVVQPSREQKGYKYDIVTIRVNRLEKKFGREK